MVVITACNFSSPVNDAGFCTENTNLSSLVENFTELESSRQIGYVVQGMCVAEDYIIVTRWKGNNKDTTFQVLDINTGEVISSFSLNTGHSNSMTYNPETNEIIVVSGDSSKKIYILNFEDGEISYKDTLKTDYAFSAICYVNSQDMYYLSTGNKIYSSDDLCDFDKEFNIKHIGNCQGMASDGTDIYLCWSCGSTQKIQRFNTAGENTETYKIDNTCRELEEIDFYGTDMYLGDNRLNKDAVFKISSEHDFSEWGTISEPTCTEPGEEKRTCNICGYEEINELPIIDHTFSDWKITTPATCKTEGKQQRTCLYCDAVEEETIPVDSSNHISGEWIEKPSTCIEPGEKNRYCIECGALLEHVTIPANGHLYSEWKEIKSPTVYTSGKKQRQCTICKYKETGIIRSLTPSVTIDSQNINLKKFTKSSINITLQTGDEILSSKTSNPLIASLSGNVIHTRFPGTATITIKTKAGAITDIKVSVSK